MVRNRNLASSWIFALALLSSGCSGSDSASDTMALDSDAAIDTAAANDSRPKDDLHQDQAAPDAAPDADSPNPCPRLAGPADYDRKVIVAHPFKPGGGKADLFEVLELSAAGDLRQTGEFFNLAVPDFDEIAFTPDGEVGVLTLENGKVGVFTIGGDGSITVVHDDFDAGSYASRVMIDSTGEYAYVLSTQWRDAGGGIYRLRIGCDGSLLKEGQVAEAKLPYAMSFVDPDRVLVVARDVEDSKAGDEVHLLNVTTDQLEAGSVAFGDGDATISAAVFNGKHLLVADDGLAVGNRLAVVGLANGVLDPLQVLTGVPTPSDVVISPFDNAAIVLNVEADKITVLDYDPSSNAPFSERGALQTPAKPLLPSIAVMITRGSLEGRVLTAENVGVRQIQFEKNGAVNHKSFLELEGEPIARITGAIGIQP